MVCLYQGWFEAFELTPLITYTLPYLSVGWSLVLLLGPGGSSISSSSSSSGLFSSEKTLSLVTFVWS